MDWGGVAVPVLGGPLEGSLRLGVCGPDPMWRTEAGEVVFRGAEGDALQCALVIDSQGVGGCSWSGEFSPLFDSCELMFEHGAAWLDVQGWRYASIVGAEPSAVAEQFTDMEIDRVASARLATWWIAPGVRVSSTPYLNPRVSSRPQVIVLVQDKLMVDDVREAVIAAVGPSGEAAFPGDLTVPAVTDVS